MISGGSILDAERIAWSGLATWAGVFLSLALRLRKDREFALLGSGLSLLLAVVAPDVWADPRSGAGIALGNEWLASLQDFQQIAACAYVWVSLRFTQALTGGPGKRGLRICAAVLAALGLGFYLDALGPFSLFVAPTGEGYASTWVFDWIYSPILIALFAWNVALTVRGWRAARGDARRTLGALSLAYALLWLGGCIDFAFMWRDPSGSPFSSTTLASLSLGLIGAYLFAARLIRLHDSQREALLKLDAIHGDLEAHRPLGELGRSAAHITEAIGSFVAELKSDAESLRRHPATGARTEVARIESARHRLETFTGGILDYARSARLGERRLLPPSELAAACLASLAPAERARVHVSGFARRPVQGDPALLRRGLGELVRNALQAGAGRVAIRLAEGFGYLSLAIEDDGHGIEFDQLDRIATPFFTTRKSEGACGLGACIAQGIFRAHGGNLAYYPAPPPARSGLLANAVLPLAGGNERGSDEAADWILVCDEAARIERFLAVCSNLGIAPAVRGSADPGPASAGPSLALVDAEAGPASGLPARWKRFRLPGDVASGDPGGGPAWLREESLIALAAAGAGVTGVLP